VEGGSAAETDDTLDAFPQECALCNGPFVNPIVTKYVESGFPASELKRDCFTLDVDTISVKNAPCNGLQATNDARNAISPHKASLIALQS
jgi:hypothetical protein